MEGIVEDEPVLTSSRRINGPSIFEEIRARASKSKQPQGRYTRPVAPRHSPIRVSRARLVNDRNNSPIQVSRARLVNNSEETSSEPSEPDGDVIQNMSNGRSSEDIYDLLMKRVAEKRPKMNAPRPNPNYPIPDPTVERPYKDLRELITKKQLERQQEALARQESDEDSFYSVSSIEKEPEIPSINYARDLINALGSDSLTSEQMNRILNKILELPIKTNVKLAEGIACAPDETKYDVFSICSLLLEEADEDFLHKYLQFFGNVMKVIFNQDNVYADFRKLVNKRSDQFQLYDKLVEILLKGNHDKVFLNSVAKIVLYMTSLSKVQVLCDTHPMAATVEKLYQKNMKYISMTCFRFIRHWYKLRHDNAQISNSTRQDMDFCIWIIGALRKYPNQEDCLYALYYMLDKMPMTNLKTIFESEKLEMILDKTMQYHQEHFNDELELLALKVKCLLNEGNFLSGKLQRESIFGRMTREQVPNVHPGLKNKMAMKRFASDTDLIPLDDGPPSAYRPFKGVLKSITELLVDDAQPYCQTDEIHVDRRMELIHEEENKIVDFNYGQMFNLATFTRKNCQVRTLENYNERSQVAADICQLLNLNSPRGILLIGVKKSAIDNVQVIIGVDMDRKERDEFRIGLDKIVFEDIVPRPTLERFGQPIFNPVCKYPGSDPKSETSRFVIRFDVKAAVVADNEEKVIYKVKNRLLKNKA